MKLGSRTIQILKNFATINPSIVFAEGNVISTINPSKSIVAYATISETITKEFGIYDLPKFLSTLGFFTDPEIKVQDKFAEITEGDQKASYHFADISMIKTPPKNVNFPDADVKFNISTEIYSSIIKGRGILGLPEIAFVGEENHIYVKAIDASGVTNDSFSIKVGDTEQKFKAIFKEENLKILPDSYEVEVSKKGISKFTSPDLVYYIAVSEKSTF